MAEFFPILFTRGTELAGQRPPSKKLLEGEVRKPAPAAIQLQQACGSELAWMCPSQLPDDHLCDQHLPVHLHFQGHYFKIRQDLLTTTAFGGELSGQEAVDDVAS